MSRDSLYPEFFRAGIGRLQRGGAGEGDLGGLFSALQNFRIDLSSRPEVKTMLEVTDLYVSGLGLFRTTAYFLINPETFAFEPSHVAPSADADVCAEIVQNETRSGKFAWALRQNTPVFFEAQTTRGPVRGVFHSLAVSNQRLGMFCGLLLKERVPSQEITFSLLSILLGTSADALVATRTKAQLKNEVFAANESLKRALRENEVLARIAAESPSPVIRLGRSGVVLYSNQPGLRVLETMRCRQGDLVFGKWQKLLEQAFASGEKQEFEASVGEQTFAFLAVPVPEADYANFYGTDITDRKRAEAEREHLIKELQQALANVKTLSGLVPICAWCKKIRDDSGFWKQLETFIESRSEATFSHGICPDCVKKYMNMSEADVTGKA